MIVLNVVIREVKERLIIALTTIYFHQIKRPVLDIQDLLLNLISKKIKRKSPHGEDFFYSP